MADRMTLPHFYYYRGRVGLCAILKALRLEKASEVAIQAFTCMAVPEGVMAAGAQPCYIDITKDGYTMCPESLRRRVNAGTKAIVVQHTFGIPTDMEPIIEIANKHNIPVIEDCCHTYLSTYKAQRIGTFGIAAFYSFEWGKPLVAGVGGGVRVNDSNLKARMEDDYKSYRQPSIYRQYRIELQYRLFSILYRPRLFWPLRNAFRFLSKLRLAEGNFHEFDGELNVSDEFTLRICPKLISRIEKNQVKLLASAEHARRLAEQYQTIKYRIDDAKQSFYADKSRDIVFTRYPLRVKNKLAVLQKARDNNLELAEWYATPVHPIPVDGAMIVGYEKTSCPNAEKRAKEIVSLPTHLGVGNWYMHGIIELFNSRDVDE